MQTKQFAHWARALGAAALIGLLSSAASAEGEKESSTVKKAEPVRKLDATVKSDAISSDPQLTTASFGDWVERCQRVATTGLKLCEVAETVQVEGQNAPLAQIAIGRADKDGPLRLTLLLPVNVSFPDAPKLKIGSAFDLSWRRCVPGGCLADVALSDADVSTLRAAAEPGQIEFKTASGQDLKFPTSSRGLLQALDALRREPVALNDVKAKP